MAVDGQRWEFRIDLTGLSVMASRVPIALPFEGPTLRAMPSKIGILATTTEGRVEVREFRPGRV